MRQTYNVNQPLTSANTCTCSPHTHKLTLKSLGPEVCILRGEIAQYERKVTHLAREENETPTNLMVVLQNVKWVGGSDLFSNSNDKTSRKFRNIRFTVQDSFGYSGGNGRWKERKQNKQTKKWNLKFRIALPLGSSDPTSPREAQEQWHLCRKSAGRGKWSNSAS